jgi:hypothetical protein
MPFAGKQIKADGFARVDRIVDPNGYSDERKLNVSFPNSAHNVLRLKNEIDIAKILTVNNITKNILASQCAVA